MTRTILSPLLAASLLLNVVLLVRPARAPRPTDATPPRNTPAPPAERPVPVDAEPAARAAPPAVVAAGPATTTRLATALADHETWNRFWTDLAKVHEAAESLEPAEYRAHVLESTADFLAVDRPSFAAAVTQVLANVDALNAEEQPVELADEALEAQATRMAQRLEAAYAPVRALLSPDSNRAHKRFLARFGEWEAMLRAWGM
jgi:hypothetical protein